MTIQRLNSTVPPNIPFGAVPSRRDRAAYGRRSSASDRISRLILTVAKPDNSRHEVQRALADFVPREEPA
jgi:hypothetical protein